MGAFGLGADLVGGEVGQRGEILGTGVGRHVEYTLEFVVLSADDEVARKEDVLEELAAGWTVVELEGVGGDAIGEHVEKDDGHEESELLFFNFNF